MKDALVIQPVVFQRAFVWQPTRQRVGIYVQNTSSPEFIAQATYSRTLGYADARADARTQNNHSTVYVYKLAVTAGVGVSVLHFSSR